LRVIIGGETRDVLAVDMRGSTVFMIDQRLLPFTFRIRRLRTWQETVQAIRDLVTRGAGSVGVAGAFAFAQAALQSRAETAEELLVELRATADTIARARPTAVTLASAVYRCLEAVEDGGSRREMQRRALEAAKAVLARDMQASKAIGEVGQELLGLGSRILTHCNTGALAIQDHGTALAIIRFAHAAGKRPFVYVSETRPWLQGSRLTTWELQQEGIPHQLVVDSVCGYLFQRGLVDAVIVGADRIAANGDVANKIGTYGKAVLAREHGVPFYVAAPTDAFDLSCPTGREIEIEEREAQEVLTVTGRLPRGKVGSVQVAPEDTQVLNPVFDVTPARYITGFITERGVLTDITPGKICRLVKTGQASNNQHPLPASPR